MKLNRVIGIGILSGLTAMCATSCKKEYKQLDSMSPALNVQLDTYNQQAEQLLQDTTYHFFGNDTLEVTKEFFTSPIDYLNELNKKAKKATPKKKVGTHTQIQMMPKSGGGFSPIPIVKNDYAPIYKEPIGVIKSNKLFTTNEKDLYVPVEYYGKIND